MKHEIKLHANKKDEPTVVNAVFGESKSHTFEFTIYDTDDTAIKFPGCTAKFVVEKKNGKIYEGVCEIDSYDLTIKHTPTTQAFTSAGRNLVFIDILGPSSDPFEMRVDGLELQVAPVKYDSLAQNSDEFQLLTQLIYKLENYDITFEEDFEKWFTEFKKDSTAKMDDLLKLLQNVDITDNKAAYLALLSKSAVPSVIKLLAEDVVTIPANGYVTLKQYRQNQYNKYNMDTSPVSVIVGNDGWIEFSDDCDLLISAAGYFYNTNFQDTSGNLRITIGYSGYNEGSYGAGPLRLAYDSIVKTGLVHVSIPLVHFNYKKGTKLALQLSNDTTTDFATSDIARTSVGSFIQFVILPDLTKFPTSQAPRVVDVTASTQDIQPGDALPKDSLYLVIGP